jgi:hypothetical protein
MSCRASLQAYAGRHRDQPLARGHRLADQAVVGLRTDVARRQDAEEPPFAVGDEQAGDSSGGRLGTRLGHRPPDSPIAIVSD